MAIVSRVTKHAARHMDAIAVTDEEKKLAAAAMAKVRTHHDVGRGAQELASVEFTLNAIWQGWPGWPVVTQLDPQHWSHTQPQSGDAVLGFVKWTRKLRMQQVHKRIEAGLKQEDTARHELFKNFKVAIRIYNLACSRHDNAVEAKNGQKRKRS